MSLYQFIACDIEIPEIICNKKKFHNENMKTVFYTESNLTNLEIKKCPFEKNYKDIPYYTNKKNIYTLDWDYSDDNCKKLLNYLKMINNNGNIIELWSIWLCDYYEIEDQILKELEKIKVSKFPVTNISFEELKALIKCEDSENTPNVIMLC